MASKALVVAISGLTRLGSTFTLFADAAVEGNDDHFTVSVQASAETWEPVSPDWRTLIATAVKEAAAAHDPPATVDSVRFHDFGLVSV